MLYNIKKAATYHYVVAPWFNSFFMAQTKNFAKVRNNFDISKFYADILRDFCERKLRLVVLPVSACPYIIRAVHIYKRLGRYLVILV